MARSAADRTEATGPSAVFGPAARRVPKAPSKCTSPPKARETVDGGDDGGLVVVCVAGRGAGSAAPGVCPPADSAAPEHAADPRATARASAPATRRPVILRGIGLP